MTELVKVAAVQTDPRLGETAANLKNILAAIAEAAAQGTRLIVFPNAARPAISSPAAKRQ